MPRRGNPARPLALAACIAAHLAVTHEAHAQTSNANGNANANANDARIDRAVAAFQAQDYTTALGLFQQLYIDTRNPALLFNIGQAQDRLHHADEAARALRQFLRLVPNAPNRADVETQIRRLDAEAAAATPGNGSTDSGSTSATPTPTPTSAPHPPPPLMDPRPIWPLAVAGVGIVGVIVGGVMLGVAEGQVGGASNAPTELDRDAIADSVNGLRTGGLIALGAGGVLTAAGAVLYLVMGPTEHHSVAHGPVVLPGFVAVTGGGVGTVTVVGF